MAATVTDDAIRLFPEDMEQLSGGLFELICNGIRSLNQSLQICKQKSKTNKNSTVYQNLLGQFQYFLNNFWGKTMEYIHQVFVKSIGIQ